MRSPEQLRTLVEGYLGDLALTPELHGQAESVRYALVGGKRVRAVICLATVEAAGADAEAGLPAAASLELVHAFSLVHDDLPALDNDAERRGRPSVWAQHGEAVAVLAGDALLAEAFRLALSYQVPQVGRELAQATLGMIGGQYLDITGSAPDEATLHKLKTGCLFAAAVGTALWVAGVPEREQAPWRAFGDELGLLFQIVDDILDGDGYVVTHGEDGARALADEAATRARERLADVPADTSTLVDIVAVGSGKGGVGKSTVSLHITLALARRGLAVGLLDADVYGPDIPLMVNLTRHEDARRWDFWRGGDVRHEPIESHGIRIMSVGFLLGERQALTLGAPLLTAALRQLVHQVEWGQLDILLLDLPPGTADLQQQLVGVVSLDGAVVVVGPQDVAHLDARKFLAFLRDADVPVLGAVENMSGLQCPHCGEVIEVFTPVTEPRSVWAEGVFLLGRIPLDPALGTPDGLIGAQSEAFDAVAAQVVDALQRRAAA